VTTSLKVLLVGQSDESLAPIRELLTSDELEIAGTAALGPAALTWAKVLEPELIVVVADESLARPIAVIQALTHGEPGWTVVAMADSFEREFVRQAMLAGARDVLVRTTPALELRQALVTARQAEATRRGPAGHAAPHAAGSIFTVTGVKGGIGKTTVALNLALSLALASDRSVALVDLDLPYGDLAMLLSLKPLTNVMSAVADPAILEDPDLLMAQLCDGPAGLHLLSAPLSGHGPDLDTAQVGPLLNRLAGLYDFVVVDTAAGYGELTAAALDAATQTLIVTVPEAPTLRRTELGLRQLAEWKYPSSRLKVVLNRASMRSGMRAEEIAEVLSEPIAWWLPDEPAASQAVATGQPLALNNPKSQIARTTRAMARQLAGIPDRPQRTFWPLRPFWRANATPVAANA
jgi:pilus assembly protein CpaE